MSREHQTWYRKARRRVRILRDGIRGRRLARRGVFDAWLDALEKNRQLLALMLHNPAAPLLDSVLTWFAAKGCTFVDQEQVIAAMQGGPALPPRPFWLTFDDGWRANVTECLPVLEAHQAPATIFLATQCVEMGFFFPEIGRYAPQMFDPPYNKDGWAYRDFRKGIDALAQHPDIAKFQGVMLTPEQVQAYAGHELLSFENHTHTHSLPRKVTDEEYRWEIEESQRRLEAWAGRRGRILCYPNGERTELTQAIAREEFEMALLVEGRPFSYTTGDPFEVTRCGCPDQGNLHSSLVRICSSTPQQYDK